MNEDQSREDLGTYLKDHYAGGVGALELLEHLIKEHGNDPLGNFFSRLREEIQADHDQLHSLMTRLGHEESSLRNAGAWMAEKLGRAKLGFGDETDGLPLFQALETLAIGITGKRLLWRALRRCAKTHPALQKIDFGALEKRALEQFDRVEAARLNIATATWASPDSSDSELGINSFGLICVGLAEIQIGED
jgi:hypothetical protein